ncbi:MAG: hypothetical protein ABIY52_02525 [Gemmatimonadaceae bacterium]
MTAATAGAQGNDRVGWKVFPSLYVVSDSVVFELRERDFPNRIGYARRETKREGVSRHPSMHD